MELKLNQNLVQFKRKYKEVIFTGYRNMLAQMCIFEAYECVWAWMYVNSDKM